MSLMNHQQNNPDKPNAGRKSMSMAIINFWLDLTLFVAVTFLVWVSAVMQAVFPAPSKSGGWTLWGFTYDQWSRAQFISLCVCAVLAIEHLVLHWNWVCSILATKVLRVKNRPDEGTQALYGVGLFIAVLALFMGSILLATFTVREPG
jgi:hypothetical protein